jgi:hypothetical protein
MVLPSSAGHPSGIFVKSLLKAGMLLLPVLLVVALSGVRLHLRRVAALRQKEALQRQYDSWKLLSFVPIRTGSNVNEQLLPCLESGFPTNTILTADQTLKLKEKAMEFFACFSEHDFDTYKKFRCAVPYKMFVENTVGKKGERVPIYSENDEMRFKAHYDQFAQKYYLRTNLPVLFGINPNSVSVSINEEKSAESKMSGEGLRYFKSLLLVSHNADITYVETPVSIIKSKGKFLCAGVRGIVQVADADLKRPMPMFVTFYWSESYSAWLPWEMASYAHTKWMALF